MEMAKRVAVMAIIFVVVVCLILSAVIVWNPLGAKKLVVDENDFEIRDEILTKGVAVPDLCVLCSNGSAWYDGYVYLASHPYSFNHSTRLSSASVLNVLHSLEEENFLQLSSSYNDTGGGGWHYGASRDILTLGSHGQNKSVAFAGAASLGILPKSELALGNIEGDLYAGHSGYSANFTLNVSIQQNNESVAISGTFTNRANFSLSGYCDGTNLWTVTVIRASDGVTVASFPRSYNPSVDGTFVFPSNSLTALNNFALNITGFKPGAYVVWGDAFGENGDNGGGASNYAILQIPEPIS